MAIEPLADLVTVAEAASILRVHSSTVWRWINRGDLPASRIGHRRVLIKREDLWRMVTPARPANVRALLPNGGKMTPEEKERLGRAIEWSRRLRAEQVAKYGVFEDSVELIRQGREERTRQLAGE